MTASFGKQTDRTTGVPPPIEDHTPGHIACPACERSHRLMIEPGALGSLCFRDAAPIWYRAHARHISAGTQKDYRDCIRALLVFFADLALDGIHAGHFEQYQQMRLAGAGGMTSVGPSRVNHELNTLSQILNRANLWAAIAPHYKPLRLPKPKVGCALSEDEEHRLFRIAAANPRWEVAYCAALLMVNTTATGSEIRNLRLGDVDLQQLQLNVQEGTKNDYRKRSLPLNEPAEWAARRLLERARERRSTDPLHYLIPHRAANGSSGWDPTRPAYSWRSAWNKLRVAAGMPKLRIHDLRHHSITRLLEDENTSERTVIELAGHVSRQMLQRYSHIRMKNKREAVDALAKKTAQSVGRPTLVLVKK